MECLICKSNSGEKRISPGPTIYEGKYWLVEHAYPTKIKGWIVIVLKRHSEALHDLSVEEFRELSIIESKIVHLQSIAMNCEKEYISCYAEKGQFNHIHFHIFAKPRELSQEFIGINSFKLINIIEEESIPKEEIIRICSELHEQIKIIT
jgi:diadenosine tetraphosphate (Ap4A) HIT family hydrolase